MQKGQDHHVSTLRQPLAAKAHVLGDRCRRAAMSPSFSVLLGSHCDVPGNNQLGYCRDQVTAST